MNNKPHLDIEFGDLCSPVHGKHAGRLGIVIDIQLTKFSKNSLTYTLLDEVTKETFKSSGSNLRLITADYLMYNPELY